MRIREYSQILDLVTSRLSTCICFYANAYVLFLEGWSFCVLLAFLFSSPLSSFVLFALLYSLVLLVTKYDNKNGMSTLVS